MLERRTAQYVRGLVQGRPFGVFSVTEFGVRGDGTDEGVKIAAAMEAVAALGGELIFPRTDQTYNLGSTVVHLSGPGFRMNMQPGAILTAAPGAGVYAIRLENCRHVELLLTLVVSAGNGIYVGNLTGIGVENSLYNVIRTGSRLTGPGKAANKPATPADGSIGLYFAGPISGSSNYFNKVQRTRLREWDTCILAAPLANAQIIEDPQIERYWYGVALESDESALRGGFAHLSPGNSSAEYTEAVRLGAGVQFNHVSGMVVEPGSNARALVIGAGATRNSVDIVDNSGLGYINAGHLNAIIDQEAGGWLYSYSGLTETVSYRLSRLTVGNNGRSSLVVIRFDSNSSATGGSSSGHVVAAIERTSAGVITARVLHSSMSRQGGGFAYFRGFEVDGASVYPVFSVHNNGTGTSSTTVRVTVQHSVGATGTSASRHSEAVVAPVLTGAVSASEGINVGTTASRPTDAEAGYQYFDVTLGRPVWWSGAAWLDATGAVA